MRDSKRISRIIAKLLKEWGKNPDLRLGQLIWNAMAKKDEWKAPEGNALFYIEDEDLEEAL